MRFDEIDWDHWQPGLEATLLFVVKESKILLIRKKRGLGAGKINGPGGKVDPGETPRVAAIREVEEELGITPSDVTKAGEVWFQVTDETSIKIHVFLAEDCLGEPVETDEATPLWTDIDAIPYGDMWADDRIWLPMMLAGTPFTIRTLFDGDQLLGHEY